MRIPTLWGKLYRERLNLLPSLRVHYSIPCLHCRTATFRWNVTVHLQGKGCVCPSVNVRVCANTHTACTRPRSSATPRSGIDSDNMAFASLFISSDLWHLLSAVPCLKPLPWVQSESFSSPCLTTCRRKRSWMTGDISVQQERNRGRLRTGNAELSKHKASRNKHVWRWRFLTIAAF